MHLAGNIVITGISKYTYTFAIEAFMTKKRKSQIKFISRALLISEIFELKTSPIMYKVVIYLKTVNLIENCECPELYRFRKQCKMTRMMHYRKQCAVTMVTRYKQVSMISRQRVGSRGPFTRSQHFQLYITVLVQIFAATLLCIISLCSLRLCCVFKNTHIWKKI